MLKPKHYPLLTLVAVTLMTVLPLGVFVLIGRSPLQDDRQAVHSPQPATKPAESIDPVRPPIARVVDPRPDAHPNSVVQTTDKSSDEFSQSDSAQASASKPAWTCETTSDQASDVDNASDAVCPPSFSDSSVWGMDDLDLTGRIASSTSKTTKPAAVDAVPTPRTQAPEPDESPTAADEPSTFIEEMPQAVQMSTSAMDATGHLIHAPASGPSPTAKTIAGSTDPAPAEPARRSRKKSRSKKTAPAENQIPAAAPGVATLQTAQTATDGSPIVDIILQTPIETRSVRRVENVVAMTNETGWPIPLIRSDLPDSRWWVQQMTSIRGNAFTARVNFGNEDSLTGSKYRLIFVFLETQDEVRRFRIAKQFKEIPAGVRRTREYRYVRK